MATALRLAGLLFVLAGAAAAAQPPAPLTVQSRTLRGPGAEAPSPQAPNEAKMSFPWVSGGAPGVAKRINDAIWLRELSLAPPLDPGKDFVLPADEQLDRLGDVGFDVKRNDARVLSIGVHIEDCSGRCSTLRDELHFDPATGRLLTIDDLFTPEGRGTLATRRVDAAVASYQGLLATLPPEPKELDDDDDGDAAAAPPPPPQSPQVSTWRDPDDAELRDFLKGCIEGWRSGRLGGTLEVSLGADGGVHLEFASCSAADRRAQAMMDAPLSPLALPMAELKPLLTPFGRHVLLGEANGAAPPANPFGHLLHGHVGDSTITLYLEEPYGESVNAAYYDDLTRRSMHLIGFYRAGTLDLTPDGPTGFALHRLKDGWEGVWNGGGRPDPVWLD